MEVREVPATFNWTNQASGDWNVANNWDQGGNLPGLADDVMIRDFQGDITITHSTGTHTVRSLTTFERLVLTGGSLTIASGGTLPASTINAELKVDGGTLALNSTIVNGSGILTNAGTLSMTSSTVKTPLTNAAGKTLSMTNSIVNAPLINQGTLFVESFGNQLNGTLTTGPDSVLNVHGGPRRHCLPDSGQRLH